MFTHMNRLDPLLRPCLAEATVVGSSMVQASPVAVATLSGEAGHMQAEYVHSRQACASRVASPRRPGTVLHMKARRSAQGHNHCADHNPWTCGLPFQ